LYIKKSTQYGQHTLTIETGRIARQACGAVVVDLDGTSVLVTAVGKHDNQVRPFFPLRVDYQEKAYANGKIPGGFFKREARPSERETLIARLIDRPIRPLFDKNFTCEVHITATVISINTEVDPDIVAMIGASAALAISGIPHESIMSAARVGYKDGIYLLNPSKTEMEDSLLELVVAGTKTSVLMVESEAKELSENIMLGAVMFGHHSIQPVISLIEELKSEAGKEVWNWVGPEDNTELNKSLSSAYTDKITAAYAIVDKLERQQQLKTLKEQAETEYLSVEEGEEPKCSESELSKAIHDLEYDIVRGKIIRQEPRIDGRSLNEIRKISVDTNILPRVHGTALFTRGETQALVTVTLGTDRDAQILDGAFGEDKDRFMLHYNFPPYCVNETGMMGSPKRREIGHGRLARRGISAVLPKAGEFPYVIRVVSEITESNGSSSMASVCGSSLALMHAGVPLKAPVAGIAMGLIKDGNDFAVISDILADEDHLGDMDFKVAGTSEGITALQMDIKVAGITEEIMDKALDQAKEGRIHILGIMNAHLSTSGTISEHAPRLDTMKVAQDKIKDVIGKGGSTIRELTENTTATVSIEDDGTVKLAADNLEDLEEIKRKIELLTADVEVNKIYSGKVSKIVDFGAFVNILPGKDGLLHISEISHKRVKTVTDELSEGQKIDVKVIEVDNQGRVRLSLKALIEKPQEEKQPE
jgi:polyribonucleotide nucleotidyltransferase